MTSTSRRSTSRVSPVRLAVHVTPKAGRDGVGGWRGSELQVFVRSAPEEGKANAAVCRALAEALSVPPRGVRVVRGHTSRHKMLEVDGADAAALRAAFGEPPEALF